MEATVEENRTFWSRKRSMSRPGFSPLLGTFMKKEESTYDGQIISANSLLFPHCQMIEAKVQVPSRHHPHAPQTMSRSLIKKGIGRSSEPLRRSIGRRRNTAIALSRIGVKTKRCVEHQCLHPKIDSSALVTKHVSESIPMQTEFQAFFHRI